VTLREQDRIKVRVLTYRLRALKFGFIYTNSPVVETLRPVPLIKYEGWNFNSGNYLFTTDTK